MAEPNARSSHKLPTRQGGGIAVIGAAVVVSGSALFFDSTMTLLRRAAKHEPVWLAHRSHFYQRATDRGFRVIEVVTRVFVVNILLAALAFVTILLPSSVTDIAAVSVGMALVAWLLVAFARGPARHLPHSS